MKQKLEKLEELESRISHLEEEICRHPPTKDFDALMGELDLLLADFKESSEHWLKLTGKNTNMAKGEAYGFCSEQLQHVLNKYKDKK